MKRFFKRHGWNVGMAMVAAGMIASVIAHSDMLPVEKQTVYLERVYAEQGRDGVQYFAVGLDLDKTENVVVKADLSIYDLVTNRPHADRVVTFMTENKFLTRLMGALAVIGILGGWGVIYLAARNKSCDEKTFS